MRRAIAILTLLALAAAAGTAFADAPAPVRAYVGVELLSVRHLDAGAGEFEAHFFLSARWPAASELDLATIGPANGTVDDRELVESGDAGRWRKAVWRIAAKFRASFPLEDFPFDRQTLALAIEHPTLPASALSLQPDLDATGVAEGFDIPGWSFERRFATHAAVSTRAGGAERARVVFRVDIRRPFVSLLAKILVPLIVVLAMAHCAFWIDPRDASTRLLLVTTAIFVAVCVHFVIAGVMPDVDYLTAADVYFLVVYVFLFCELVLATWSHRLVLRERAAAVARLDRIVRWTAPPLAVIAAVAGTWDAAAERPAARAVEAAPVASTRAEMVVGVIERPVAFGPWCESNTEYFITRLVMEPLAEPDAGGTTQPLQALEVPSFENGRIKLRDDGGATMRWTLRPGLRWGDGKAVRPTDFTTTGRDDTFHDARSVRVVDGDLLAEYDAPQPAAIFDAFLFPRHRLDGLSEADERRVRTRDLPPHAGPFILERFERDRLLFRRNPHHAPAAALERLVVRIYDGPDELAAAVRRGEVHLVPPGQIDIPSATAIARDTRSVVVKELETNYVWHLDVNLDDPVLADRRVRQALLYGLDRDALVREVTGGHGAVAHSWVSPTHPGYHARIKRYPYDPARAAKLLKEAGVRLPLTLKVSRGDRHPKAIVDIIKRCWGALGIEVVDDAHEYGEYMNVYSAQMKWPHFSLWAYDVMPYDTGRSMWPEDRIPTEANGWAGLNYSRWRDPRMKPLHERLDRTFNVDDLVELMAEQQDIWAEELPALTLYSDREALITGATVRGVRPHVLGPGYLSWNAAEWRFQD